MRILIAGAAALLIAAGTPAGEFDWAFRGSLATPPAGGWDDKQPLKLPGATKHFTLAQTRDTTHAVDWYPDRHPPMPRVVAATGPDSSACGFCHLPGGGGRPENAAIAGLPAAYIVAQVRAFASGERSAVHPKWRPTALMVQTARHTGVKDVKAVALYFSILPYVSHVTVEETATIATPRTSGVLLMPGDSAAREPLGKRIAEGPVELERFEWRDPDAAIVAWVPPGSIPRGAALARGNDERPACDTCHGKDLRGDIGPPLAGRFPAYLFRQLAGFRTGSRATPEAEAMRTISGSLSNADMIALAAYAGSLRP